MNKYEVRMWTTYLVNVWEGKVYKKDKLQISLLIPSVAANA
jgi:hypothetical protein